MIFAEGLENVFTRHRLLAEATRRAVGTWAEGQAIALQRLRAGGALRHRDRRSSRATARARSRWSITAARNAAWCSAAVSAQSEGKGFRIAHMGHVNAPMIFGTLSVVEMALAALGMPHGKGGVQAAVEFLAKACRR